MFKMNYYLEVLKEYSEFEGRITRKKYWMFILISSIISIILNLISPKFSAAYGVAIFLPGVGAVIRRLHDTNRSGWWILINLIPILGTIVFLVFLLQDSTPGKNKYGLNPKPKENSKVECNKCGEMVSLEDDFCSNCGDEIINQRKQTCHNCNSIIDKDIKFCPKCGQKLKKDKELNDQDEKNENYKIQGETVQQRKKFLTLQKQASRGYTSSQFKLARLYYKEKEGVDKNIDKALKWFKRAAENDHAEAQFYIGDIFYQKENLEEAKNWYKKAIKNAVENDNFDISKKAQEGLNKIEN